MKKVLQSILFLTTLIANSQENFEWVVKDSVQKTKNEIYIDTKDFISETFNSTKAVIDYDEKEDGIIAIKPVVILSAKRSNWRYKYTYTYTLKFRMKDNKYMVEIQDVHCSNSRSTKPRVIAVDPIHPFAEDECDISTWSSGIVCKQAIPLMEELKQELNSIIPLYQEFIKKKSILSEDW